jgi:hypothetical protein
MAMAWKDVLTSTSVLRYCPIPDGNSYAFAIRPDSWSVICRNLWRTWRLLDAGAAADAQLFRIDEAPRRPRDSECQAGEMLLNT